MFLHRFAGQPRPDPKGPGECFPAYGEVVARGRGVQMRSSTGSRPSRIGYDGWSAVRIRPCDDSQQLAPGGPLPASDTRADSDGRRPDRGDAFVNHHVSVYRVRSTTPNRPPRVP